ncbi:MAG TPA: Lrp/AsnC ligand binding domain-containing protein, partial [Alicycliphilus sp.]|nr:Lrp/AsnC ligand binding domain-containing protein [Alicycliphilus sp.]
KRLEAQGVITGYHARVNPAALGRSLLVFVEITLAQKSEQIFKKVRDELQNMPEVLECHLISGSFDYLVKARLAGMSEYRSLLGSILQQMPVPAQSNSYVVMEEVKESFVVPLGRRP